MEFAVIGAGRLGRRLALRLIESGARCSRMRLRSVSHSNLPAPLEQCADSWQLPTNEPWPRLIFVTVQDSELELVARLLAADGSIAGSCVLHTSGLHTSESLAECMAAGATAASWHPLQSFPADPAIKTEWYGTPCAIEGDADAVDTGFEVAERLLMTPWRIDPRHKAVYHAAAALAGNLPNILIAAARSLMGQCGLPDGPDGTSLLAPLVRTCVEGALVEEAADNLTGPIARGDQSTVERHLEVLPEGLSRCYRALFEHLEQHKPTSWHD
jgi:predicted short-subunit dehydrogenase-like oxidoreductase (DUF2520 family)